MSRYIDADALDNLNELEECEVDYHAVKKEDNFKKQFNQCRSERRTNR